jgi:hypothetical protein
LRFAGSGGKESAKGEKRKEEEGAEESEEEEGGAAGGGGGASGGGKKAMPAERPPGHLNRNGTPSWKDEENRKWAARHGLTQEDVKGMKYGPDVDAEWDWLRRDVHSKADAVWVHRAGMDLYTLKKRAEVDLLSPQVDHVLEIQVPERARRSRTPTRPSSTPPTC